jgi:ergothioneine biosynthesis protein EgtB
MKDNYLYVRANTVNICSELNDLELSIQPKTEVSPPKWHLGHTTWFFEKIILEKYVSDYICFNDEFSFVFNSYYKQVGKHVKQSDRGEINIEPSQILKYREYVDAALVSLLKASPEREVLDLVEIGLNHEEQHQELLHMDIKAIVYSLDKEYSFKIQEKVEKEFDWFDIPEGIIECGISNEGFCFDNESPRHKVYQHKASLNKELVSNAQFKDFIDSGGYNNSKYWLSKGWEWVEENSIEHPLYWSDHLDPSEAVSHISYFEADAYANWKGFRLPTEFEHEYFDKVNQKCSSLWSWTSSQYTAYPGFKRFDGELSEYNGKFMCNQFVLRGGCFATPLNHWRESYRNFYEPHQQWMFSGIRLAKDSINEGC